MKPIFLTLFFIITFFYSLSAQYYCTYAGGSCASNLTKATAFANRTVASICDVLGIRHIPVYQSSAGNACAFDLDGRSYISYNPRFMEYLANHNEWAPIATMAHEVGHHYNQDASSLLRRMEHSWTRELQADFISGYVMYKLGASLSDSQSAFYVLFTWFGSESHPDSPRRINAITQGYRTAALGY